MHDLNATMFYKAKFHISTNGAENFDLLWKLVLDIRYWICGKLNRYGHTIVEPDVKKWTYFKTGSKLYDLEENNAFYAESSYHEDQDDSQKVSWACMIVEKPTPPPGRAPRSWTTEIGYQSTKPGSCELSYVVTYSDTPGFIGPCIDVPSLSVPKVIRNLLTDPTLHCTIGNTTLSAEAQKLFPGDYPKFEQLLLDPNRALPIVYISPKRVAPDSSETRLLVSPESMAHSVAANALVYYSENIDFSSEMRYTGNSNYTCSGGAVRVYFPNADPSNPIDHHRHRYLPANEIEAQGEEFVLNIFRRALAQDVHFYDSMFRLDNCRALHAADKHRARLNEIRAQSEGDVDEALQELLNESAKREEAEQLALDYSDQLDDQRRENYSLNMRLEALNETAQRCALIEQANQSVRSVSEFPNTPQKLAQYFEALFPDRIAFTERGYRSLEDCPTKCDLLWEVFFHVATDLYDLLHANPAQAYKEFTNRTGWECSRGEGSMTRKDANLMKQYVDKYNGQEIDIEPHVKNGIKESDPRFVRLHFAYDPTITDRILIGHCGKHLDNYSTRKVK